MAIRPPERRPRAPLRCLREEHSIANWDLACQLEFLDCRHQAVIVDGHALEVIECPNPRICAIKLQGLWRYGLAVIRIACFVIFATLAAVGCQSEPAASESTPSKVETSTNSDSTGSTASDDSPVSVGMEMADVKKALGTPDETKHEHGAGGVEVDIWTYKDRTVTFENGKVSKTGE